MNYPFNIILTHSLSPLHHGKQSQYCIRLFRIPDSGFPAGRWCCFILMSQRSAVECITLMETLPWDKLRSMWDHKIILEQIHCHFCASGRHVIPMPRQTGKYYSGGKYKRVNSRHTVRILTLTAARVLISAANLTVWFRFKDSCSQFSMLSNVVLHMNC